KWIGKCPSCGEWNSLAETAPVSSGKTAVSSGPAPEPVPLSGIEVQETARIVTGVGEFDNVLGGGIVFGSLVLVGGDPGIGKTTLLMQVCSSVALGVGDVLYVSGEESARQLRLRGDRLEIDSDRFMILTETNLRDIERTMDSGKYSCVVIDSIQTMFLPEIQSAPGSITQVRESAAYLMKIAKNRNIPVFLIGHVTKEGSIAGPRVLEHIVDTVLYFEGDSSRGYRILRAIKNRFGAANEIAVFHMGNKGLSEVINPSEVFMSERREGAAGSVVTCTMEGTRPLLVEIQALVSKTTYGYPQRVASGINQKRLTLILAVLEKIQKYPTGQLDVFVNIAGGLKVDEPAADLAVAAAIASSFRNKPVAKGLIIIGEMGLGGEVRPAGGMEMRIKEAAKLGFNNIIGPSSGFKGIKPPENIGIYKADDLRAAFEAALGTVL
ncbi:MAG: DNA repair protein RadA, partial [Fibrobacterota bacterium]